MCHFFPKSQLFPSFPIGMIQDVRNLLVKDQTFQCDEKQNTTLLRSVSSRLYDSVAAYS